MQIVHCQFGDERFYGFLEQGQVVRFSDFCFSRPLAEQQALLTGQRYALVDCHLWAPVLPKTVAGLAYNFKDLVGKRDEYDEPLLFLKSPGGIIAAGEAIQLPRNQRCWVEVELVVVIGKVARNLKPGEGERAIYGYLIGNDVTAQNVYGRDHHLARSKALDTFAPVSTVLHTELDTSALRMTTHINGTLFQDGTTANMIANPAECVELVSQFMTLQPGDVIFTGTPKNAMNSIVTAGDESCVAIAGLGELRNPVVWREA